MNDALSPNQEHLITLSSFEGPLDLLLYLIKKDELDIYNIPIASVTNQYIDSIKKMEQLNLEVAGEFFVMASTLMYIKSRYLLPKKDRDNASFVEEEDDPRWELVEKLIEYKKFKNLATDIQGLIEKTNDYHPRYISDRTHHLQQKPLKPVDRVEIWNVFNNVLSRLSDKITQGQINEESVTVSERMSFILSKLNVESKFYFSNLFENKTTLNMIVATFLAILELTRLGEIQIDQNSSFDDILCQRA